MLLSLLTVLSAVFEIVDKTFLIGFDGWLFGESFVDTIGSPLKPDLEFRKCRVAFDHNKLLRILCTGG